MVIERSLCVFLYVISGECIDSSILLMFLPEEGQGELWARMYKCCCVVLLYMSNFVFVLWRF